MSKKHGCEQMFGVQVSYIKARLEQATRLIQLLH